jgi:membrane-associated HD superfamily phosphohydrolase
VNFNYSYRAFLITSLLVGNLVLFLVSVRLSSGEISEESYTAVEYSVDLAEVEEETPNSEIVKIQTNTAYNEAEKFISELENSRNETPDLSEETTETAEIDSEIDFSNDIALNDAKDKLNEIREKLSNNSKKRTKKAARTSVNRKTSTSYYLEDRKKLYLPIPVYTCDTSGKIVIDIQVNGMGKVVKAAYNKTVSTTSNGCLIESALKYASRSKFNPSAITAKQVGTITYSFPGQN